VLGRFGPVYLATDGDFCTFMKHLWRPLTGSQYTPITGCPEVDTRLFVNYPLSHQTAKIHHKTGLDEFKPIAVAYKHIPGGASAYKKYYLAVGNMVVAYMNPTQIVTSKGMFIRVIDREHKYMYVYTFLLDIDENGDAHAIFVIGWDRAMIVVNDIAINGFAPYLTFKVMGLIDDIDWKYRIERIKELKTWHPLYGPYYFDKKDMDRAVRWLLNIDFVRQMGLLKKKARASGGSDQ